MLKTYFDFVGNMLKLCEVSLTHFPPFCLFLSPYLSPSTGFVKLNLQMVGVFLIIILIRYLGAIFEVVSPVYFAVLTPSPPICQVRQNGR